MRKILSCEFNLDTACVELHMEDGTLLSIECTAVENEVANSMHQRVRTGLADLQRSAGLCRAGFEWRPRQIPTSNFKKRYVGLITKKMCQSLASLWCRSGIF